MVNFTIIKYNNNILIKFPILVDIDTKGNFCFFDRVAFVEKVLPIKIRVEYICRTRKGFHIKAWVYFPLKWKPTKMVIECLQSWIQLLLGDDWFRSLCALKRFILTGECKTFFYMLKFQLKRKEKDKLDFIFSYEYDKKTFN